MDGPFRLAHRKAGLSFPSAFSRDDFPSPSVTQPQSMYIDVLSSIANVIVFATKNCLQGETLSVKLQPPRGEGVARPPNYQVEDANGLPRAGGHHVRMRDDNVARGAYHIANNNLVVPPQCPDKTLPFECEASRSLREAGPMRPQKTVCDPIRTCTAGSRAGACARVSLPVRYAFTSKLT